MHLYVQHTRSTPLSTAYLAWRTGSDAFCPKCSTATLEPLALAEVRKGE